MTEKNYAPTKLDKKMSKEKVKAPVETPTKKIEKTDDKKVAEEKTESVSEKKGEVKHEKKETKKTVKKIKKDFAVVNADNARISPKYAIEICRFIKNKKIGDAIRDLEEVMVKKKSVPMRGEYAHRKGVGKIASGAGKYPVNASKAFIVLLKSLAGNSIANDMNEPYVAEAIANNAPRPRGRFGRWERKRCHVKLVARELKIKNSEGKK